jgi:hypothetical protein
MSIEDEIAPTKDEAIRRGYKKVDKEIMGLAETTVARRRSCGTLVKGDWCLITNCRPDGTLTVCYCDGNGGGAGNCGECYIGQCTYQADTE